MATTAPTPRASLVERTPPQLFFVGSAIFHYLGPAFAVLLFARVDPLGVAWLRIASAAAVFAAWRRPWRAVAGLRTRRRRRLVLALGAVFALMNVCFYVAIDRLPLGTVAAIEFLPVIVARRRSGTRTARNGVALALAVPGVYLLTDVRLEGEPVGVAFAFANAVLFAVYIVLAHRLARDAGTRAARRPRRGHARRRGRRDAAWRLERGACAPRSGGARRRLRPSASRRRSCRTSSTSWRWHGSAARAYSLMVALLPATATVIGIVVLGQLPSAIEVAGVSLVVAAVAVHRE